jgi:hypothetical protein
MQAPAQLKLLSLRRWLQIRLRTFFLLGSVICVCLAWPHLSRQYAFWRLCRYGNLERDDLWTKDSHAWGLEPKSVDTQIVENLVHQLLGDREKRALFNLDRLWLLQRINGSRARLIILKVSPPTTSSSSGDLQIALLDGSGRVIADETISTGYDLMPDYVTYDPTGHNFPCVIVDGTEFFGGEKGQRGIAIHGDKITLVRAIREGNAERGLGGWHREFQFGPERRFAGPLHWTASLNSTDEITQLEALLHLPSEVIAKRDSLDLARLEQLLQANDPWIRQGAKFALAEFHEARYGRR